MLRDAPYVPTWCTAGARLFVKCLCRYASIAALFFLLCTVRAQYRCLFPSSRLAAFLNKGESQLSSKSKKRSEHFQNFGHEVKVKAYNYVFRFPFSAKRTKTHKFLRKWHEKMDRVKVYPSPGGCATNVLLSFFIAFNDDGNNKIAKCANTTFPYLDRHILFTHLLEASFFPTDEVIAAEYVTGTNMFDFVFANLPKGEGSFKWGIICCP
jgi:hypothetical protein